MAGVGVGYFFGSRTLIEPVRSTKPEATPNLYIGCEADARSTVYSMLIDVYRRSGDVDVSLDTIPSTYLHERILAALAAGTGELDIVEFAPRFFADYKEYLLPLNQYLAEGRLEWDDYMPSVKHFYCANPPSKDYPQATVYGCPIDGETWVLYYRNDLMNHEMERVNFKRQYDRELAPPKTWEEYNEIAKFFTRPPDFNGLSICGKRGSVWVEFEMRFGGYGGHYFDSNGNPAIDSDAGYYAFMNLQEAVKYGPSGALSFDCAASQDAFTQGLVFMNCNWSIQGLATEAKDSFTFGRTGYAPVPKRAPLPFGWSLGISRDTKNPEEALNFIEYVTSSIGLKMWASYPGSQIAPCRQSQFEDESFIQNAGGPAYYEALKHGLKTGFPEIIIPHGVQFTDVLDREISLALTGEKTVDRALASVDDEWNQLLDRYSIELPSKPFPD